MANPYSNLRCEATATLRPDPPMISGQGQVALFNYEHPAGRFRAVSFWLYPGPSSHQCLDQHISGHKISSSTIALIIEILFEVNSKDQKWYVFY